MKASLLGTTCMARRKADLRGSVENALLIAMVTVALIGGVTFLGAAASGVFSGLGSDMPVARHRSRSFTDTQPTSERRQAEAGFNGVIAAGVAVCVVALGGFGLIYLLGDKRQGANPEDERADEPIPVKSRLYQFLMTKRQTLLRNITGEHREVDTSQLQVRHLMTRNPRTISGMMLREDVEEMMNRQGVHHVLIVDSDHKLLGVISDRDMKRRGKNAFELMTPQPVAVSPHDLASPAITLMMDRRISCLPVINANGVLCGVLTGTDLLMGFQCVLQSLTSGGHSVAVSPAAKDTSSTELQNAV